MLDIGAIFGSMALGYISDKTYGKRSLVSLGAVVLASMIAFIIKNYVFIIPTALFLSLIHI